MKTGYEHDIEVKGQYIYINNHCVKLDSDKQAQEFLMRLIVDEGFLSKRY
jgi:hypothetical protein